MVKHGGFAGRVRAFDCWLDSFTFLYGIPRAMFQKVCPVRLLIACSSCACEVLPGPSSRFILGRLRYGIGARCVRHQLSPCSIPGRPRCCRPCHSPSCAYSLRPPRLRHLRHGAVRLWNLVRPTACGGGSKHALSLGGRASAGVRGGYSGMLDRQAFGSWPSCKSRTDRPSPMFACGLSRIAMGTGRTAPHVKVAHCSKDVDVRGAISRKRASFEGRIGLSWKNKACQVIFRAVWHGCAALRGSLPCIRRKINDILCTFVY